MKWSYRLPDWDEDTVTLAQELVNILVDANVPFKKVLDALKAAEDILESETKPAKI